MDKDIIINKVAIIERCLRRIQEEYDNNPLNLENYTKQDSVIQNNLGDLTLFTNIVMEQLQ